MKAYIRLAAICCVLLESTAIHARPVFDITPNLVGVGSPNNIVFVRPKATVVVGFLAENVSGQAFAGGLSYYPNVNQTNLFSAKIGGSQFLHFPAACGPSLGVNATCSFNVTITAGSQLGSATVKPMICYLGRVCSTATHVVTVVVEDNPPV